MLALKRRGAVTFDYGNNLRGQVQDHRGLKDAFQIPGFVPPLCPPGQGIVLPASAFQAPRMGGSQVLAAPADASALPADAPVLLQVQP